MPWQLRTFSLKNNSDSRRKIFHFTVDCDLINGSEIALQRLYGIIEKFNLRPTFFISGKFAEDNEQLIREMVYRNYEIGMHGWKHGNDVNENFGSRITRENKKNLLAMATKTIYGITHKKLEIFRAPKNKIDIETFELLARMNYHIDSSVPSRRCDCGFGTVNSVRYFLKSTRPFFIFDQIFEIPPSAFVLPINMRLVRSFGPDFAAYLARLTSLFSGCLVFYIHPAEFVSPDQMIIPKDEPNKMFYKSCGEQNFDSLEHFIKKILRAGFWSCDMKTHYEMAKSKKASI